MPKKTLYRRAKSTFNRNLKLLRMYNKGKAKFYNALSSRILSHKAKQLGFSRTRRLQVFRHVRKADLETKFDFMSRPTTRLKEWLKNKKIAEKQRRVARMFGEKL